MKEYKRFTDLVESSIGQPLQTRVLHGVKEQYCPIHNVYFVQPTKDLGKRWGLIHCEGTQSNLSLIQGWLECFFGTRKHILDKLVKLSSIEFAYDFPCSSEAAACKLAVLFSMYLWPMYAQTTYTTIVSGNTKKTSDGAVNGTQTIYIQSSKRSDSGKDSDELNRNLDATRRTQLYPKELDRQYLRIEMKLSGKPAKTLMEDHYADFTGLLEVARNRPFSHFWIFKKVNVDKFNKDWRTACGFNVKRILSTNLPKKTIPVSDQVRLARAAAKVLGSKFQNKVPDYISTISFSQVMSEALPDGFRISPRRVKKTESTKSTIGISDLSRDFSTLERHIGQGMAAEGTEQEDKPGQPYGQVKPDGEQAAIDQSSEDMATMSKPDGGELPVIPDQPLPPCPCESQPGEDIAPKRAELPFCGAFWDFPMSGKGGGKKSRQGACIGQYASPGGSPCRAVECMARAP